MARLKALDREHCLAIVFSHRSYLDGWVLPNVMASRRFSPLFTFGGANLDLPVVGAVVSRTGIIFIKRETKEIPVYRLTLRACISHLVQRRANLAWSIEEVAPAPANSAHPCMASCAISPTPRRRSDGPDVMLVPCRSFTTNSTRSPG